MANPCTRCKAPCRFLLCRACYANLDPVGDDFLDMPAPTAATLPDVGLPVSAFGVRRR